MQRITESLAREILPLVQAMKHEDFERMIVDHLDRRREDFVNVKKGPRGRDGGSDITALLVAPDNQPRKVSVQCKRYKSTSLSSEDVSDTFQGITNTASDLGILASSQELSQSARDYIQGLGRRWGAEIRWEEWCGTGLMKTLLRFPSVLLEYFPGIRSRLPLKHEWEPACPGFEIVTGQEPPSGSPERFYNGFPPAWSDLAGNHDIGRRSYDSVLRIVKNISAPSPGKVPGGVITGSAGAGKTTLLRRAGFDAARSGMLTIILKNDWRTYSSGLALQVGELARISKSRVLVLVDDVADLGARRLEGMLRELAEEGVPACFLFAEESGPWNFVLKYVPSVRDMRPSHVRLTELLDSERDELVDRILQYEHDGLIQSHCRLTRSERLGLFEAAEHQMVVALFKLRHGANFRTIIEREYDRIPDALTQSLYATVCYLCGRFGFAIPENLALKQTGINQPTQIDLFVAVTKDLLVEEAGLLKWTPLSRPFFARNKLIFGGVCLVV
jgi:hypothetical protein